MNDPSSLPFKAAPRKHSAKVRYVNRTEQKSPPWSAATKLVMGMTIAALLIALIFQFRNLIGPLLLALILSFLLHPLAEYLSRIPYISWRTAVNLIFLLLLILLIGSSTVAGLAIIQQLQSLIGFIQSAVTDLPRLIADLSTNVYRIGPFELNLAQLNLQTISQQVLSSVQPVLGRLTEIISTFATSAAVTMGWGLFILLISYFMLVDARNVPDSMTHIELPGYSSDLRRLGTELKNVWSAFLRGQLIIFVIIFTLYTFLLGIVGLRYIIVIALLAGLAKFVPYAGPAIVWTITALVAYFQNGNYFGLDPLYYAILVVVLAMFLDQILDNLVTPRIMGVTLGVHPAAVLIAALVAASLLGFVGLVLAAPVLASLQLLTRYIVRKMFDLEPWPEQDLFRPVEMPWAQGLRLVQGWWLEVTRRIQKNK